MLCLTGVSLGAVVAPAGCVQIGGIPIALPALLPRLIALPLVLPVAVLGAPARRLAAAALNQGPVRQPTAALTPKPNFAILSHAAVPALVLALLMPARLIAPARRELAPVPAVIAAPAVALAQNTNARALLVSEMMSTALTLLPTAITPVEAAALKEVAVPALFLAAAAPRPVITRIVLLIPKLAILKAAAIIII